MLGPVFVPVLGLSSACGGAPAQAVLARRTSLAQIAVACPGVRPVALALLLVVLAPLSGCGEASPVRGSPLPQGTRASEIHPLCAPRVLEQPVYVKTPHGGHLVCSPGPRERKAAAVVIAPVLRAEQAAPRSAGLSVSHGRVRCAPSGARTFRCSLTTLAASRPGQSFARGFALWEALVTVNPTTGRMSLRRANLGFRSPAAKCTGPEVRAHNCIES